MHFGYFLLALIIALLSAWFGIPDLFRRLSARRLGQLVKKQRAIILTYDDGPSENLTQELLDLLNRRGVHATFFLIGREAVNRPAIVQRMIDEGHEIGNHTQDHLNSWKSSPFRAVRDIRLGRQQLAKMGVEHRVFRPPFGKSTLLTLLHCLRRGIRLAFWTQDSRDSWGRLPIHRVLDEITAAEGAVLLMHDFDMPRRGPSPEKHQEYVLKLTEAVIDFAERNNFSIIRFSDLFIETTSKEIRERA